ncbi:MAG: hypothetical protein V7784_06185 [Oceanospirillaceae bacterium]
MAQMLSNIILKMKNYLKQQHGLIAQIVDEWCERLADISWCMRCLNELSPETPILKIIAKTAYIRCHPWQSPFGLARAVQF